MFFLFWLVGTGWEDLIFDFVELLGCENCGVTWIIGLEEVMTMGCCSCLVLCLKISPLGARSAG